MKSVTFKSIVLLAILSAVCLTSCTSTEAGTGSTEADIIHTLDFVRASSQTQTVTTLFQGINSFGEDMVPEDYSFLNDLRGTVPGLDRILSRWAHSTTVHLIPLFDGFSDYTQRLVRSLEFIDPQAMISSGDDSISQLIRELYFDEISDTINRGVEDLDLELWHEAAIQYNAWVRTSALLGNDVGEPIEVNSMDDAFRRRLSEHLANLYLKYFAKAETLIRTTPDPNMDSTVSAVLGLQ